MQRLEHLEPSTVARGVLIDALTPAAVAIAIWKFSPGLSLDYLGLLSGLASATVLLQWFIAAIQTGVHRPGARAFQAM
ncbi:hypothetical protein IW148_005253 [Coemansia sp. RSA 1199]|nr:hypothetical protein IW148_005253 [Coemansia sp. RSA 1199]